MTGLVLGVDGGGTGSRAVLVDGEGRERGRVEGGPAVADGDPEGPTVRQIRRLCATLLRDAGVQAPVDALWAGLAGGGRPDTRGGVVRGLREAGLAERVGISTDVEAAFHEAFVDEPGILLVVGTGSAAWGRSREGREGRAGGWGPRLGDEGSGYALGLAGLRAVVRAADGRGPATSLRDALLEATGPGDAGDDRAIPFRLLHWLDAAQRADVAALAPVVVARADEGDSVASELVRSAVEELVGHVTALERSLGPWAEPPRVALGGGLVSPGRPLSEIVARALQAADFRVLAGSPDGARGAARLAARLAQDAPTAP